MPRMGTTMATMATLALLAGPAGAAAARARTAGDQAADDMVAAINHARARHGLHALRTSSSLMASAQRFSHWLMAKTSSRTRGSIRASSRLRSLGEALARHSGHRFDVRRTVDQWLGSPAHRALVLSRTMRRVGTGAARGRLGPMPATIWVLHLARL